MKKKLLASISALLIGTMVLTGCGSASAAGGRIEAVGSTTVAVPMEKLAEEYEKVNTDVVIEIQGVGSSAGVQAAIDETAEIGMASRELKDEEKASGIREIAIAHDGIALITHSSNSGVDLTMEQVKDIFEGTITNWSEVGGADQDIIVVTREEGSGTRGAFEEIVGLQDSDKASTITPEALVQEGTGAVRADVSTKEGAIGFISLGYLDDTVSAVSVDGVEPTADNIVAGSYGISRPLLILTQPEVDAHVDEFIDWILSDGQAIMAESYIPVN